MSDQTLEQMRADIVQKVSRNWPDVRVLWLDADRIRVSVVDSPYYSNLYSRLRRSEVVYVCDIVSGPPDYADRSNSVAVLLLQKIRQQFLDYVLARDAVTNTATTDTYILPTSDVVYGRMCIPSEGQVIAPDTYVPNVPHKARVPKPSPASKRAPKQVVEKQSASKQVVEKQVEVKRTSKLPKAFLALDLPTPQEAMPVTPFVPRASPDTYKSVTYQTEIKSRASFQSGKTPWTMPALEIY